MQKLRRYRQLIILSLLFICGLWIVALRQRQRLPDSAPTRLFLRISAPPLRVLRGIDRAFARFCQRQFQGAELQRENDLRAAEIMQLRAQRDMLRRQNRSLERLGRLAETPNYDRYSFIPAGVIGRGVGSNAQTIKIDKGAADGVRPGAAVVGLDGLVGVTVEVVPRAALVRLVTDRYFAAAALIEESRLQGYVQGEGRGEPLAFHYDNLYVRPQRGQRVISSGSAGSSDSILPGGLLLGRVAGAVTGEGSLPFAAVAPAADFDALEAVAVLVPRIPATDETTSDTLSSSSTMNSTPSTSGTLNIPE